MTSLKGLISLVATHNFYIHHMNVTTTFFHGHLKKEIYFDQLENYVNYGKMKKLCKLLNPFMD
jgi:hypothetical protein